MNKFNKILLFLSILIIFILIQFSFSGSIGPDAFFHLKISMLLKNNGILEKFPWMQFSILNNNYSDYSFLYHLLLIPLVHLPALVSIKILSALLSTIIIYIIYWIISREKVKYPLIYLVPLFSSAAFMFRLSLGRPFALAIIFSILGFYLIWKEKIIFLFFVSLLFSLSYSASILIVVFSLFFLLARLIKKKKYNLQLLLVPLLGIFLGLLFHPNFPNNLYINSIFFSDIFRFPSVSAEMLPISLSDLILGSFLIWLIFCSSLVLIIYYRKNLKLFKKRISPEGLAAIFSCLCFFVLTVRSQRFIEYWIPFTVLTGALLARDFKLDEKIKYSLNGLKRAKYRNLIFSFAPLILPLLLIFFLSISWNHMAIRKSIPYNRFQKSSEWLAQNTSEKSNVFNTSWDDFPELFYWNTHNYYIVGMDPTFMYEYDKNLYKKWQDIGTGKDSNPSEAVKKYFDSEIIIVNKEKNSEFIKTAENDPGLEKSYEDEWAIIYKIKN